MTFSAIVLSLLALVPKAQPERDDRDQRIAGLEKRIETLEAERDRALEGIELVQAQLDRAVQRIADLERYSARDRDAYYAQQAQQTAQQTAQQPLQQAMGQQAYVNMLNQMPNNVQNAQDLLGPEYCNCVPARHDLLMPRRA